MLGSDDDSFGFYQLVMRKHACRLRYILHQLDRGVLSQEDLKKNLEYAAVVLETAYADDTRRILEEDEELIDFNPDAVPNEVREWLSATFTKQNLQRQRLKFKSVANAIRTGIRFDKIFRRLSSFPTLSLSPQISAILQDINSWNFDVFRLNEISENNALKYVGIDLFHTYKFTSKYRINMPVLETFLNYLQIGYSKHKNPYHNLLHAADVTQTVHWIISQTGISECMSELELFACLFAALIHDYEHTGHTNNFHVQSGSDFTLLYNDRSVLENHHVSAIYRLMHEHADANILTNLTKEEFRVDKLKALCLIVHCCDISHPSKVWPLHYRWTTALLEEFFRQGDLENSMGLPYSPLCDRHTVHVANSQVGFIDFIVEPTMLVCGDMLTKMVEPLIIMSPNPSNFDHNLNGSLACDRDDKRFPLDEDGKLCIPQPWIKIIQDNKSRWKEQATLEEAERKRREANVQKS